MRKKIDDEGTEESELIHTRDFDPNGEVSEDYDADFSGQLGPEYHVKTVQDSVKLFLGKQEVHQVKKDLLKPEYQTLDYKVIIEMLTAFKKGGLDNWKKKFQA